MERNSHDDDKDTSTGQGRPPVHVPLRSFSAQEGGILNVHRPQQAETSGREDLLAPLREKVMERVTAFEADTPVPPNPLEAEQHRREDEDEDEDDTAAAPAVPAAATPQPVTPAEGVIEPVIEVPIAAAQPAEEIIEDFEPQQPLPPTPVEAPVMMAQAAEAQPEEPTPPPTQPFGVPTPHLPFMRAQDGAPRLPAEQPQPVPAVEAPMQPPVPPAETPPPAPAAEAPQPPDWNRPETRMAYAQQPEPLSPFTERAMNRSAEYHSLQREIAGGFITSVLISWYLAHRMVKKHDRQNQRDFKEVRTQHQQLTERHQELQQNFNRYVADNNQAKAVAEARPQQAHRQELTAEQMAVLQQQAAEQEQQNQQKVRYEQDAWKRYAVVNGKLEQNAIDYGRAFREEQQPEQAGNRFAVGQQGAAGQAGPVPMAGMPMLQSGQSDPSYQLPASSPLPPDPQHMLPTTTVSPILDAAKNPWVWIGVGVLIFAFFAAAFL